MPTVEQVNQRVADTLIEQITRGNVDAHLKDIARAVFARRDVVNGTDHSLKKLPKDKRYHPDAPKDDVNPGVGTLTHLKAYSSPGTNRFELNGEYYMKSHLIGHTFRIPEVTRGIDPIYRGLMVEVVEVKRTRIAVIFRERPKFKNRKAWRIIDAIDNEVPVLLPLTVLKELVAVL